MFSKTGIADLRLTKVLSAMMNSRLSFGLMIIWKVQRISELERRKKRLEGRGELPSLLITIHVGANKCAPFVNSNKTFIKDLVFIWYLAESRC